MKIRSKLVIYFLFLAIIPGLLISSLFYQYYKTDIFNQFNEGQQQLIASMADQLSESIYNYIQDVKLTAIYPPIQGIIRSSETGIDPVDGSTIEDWMDRLESIFVSAASVHEGFFQIRFIDEKGQELVRIDSQFGSQQIVPDSDLQNKVGRDYFIETMKLSPGQIYISNIELNQEQGKVQVPYVPTIRIAQPIFDEVNGQSKGIVIINLHAQQILDKFSLQDGISQIILTDQNGNFLFHPDLRKSFSHEIDQQYNYFDEQPELIENTITSEKTIYYDEEDGEYRIWQKVFYNPVDKSKYWILYSVVDESELVKRISDVRNYLVIAWTLISVIIVLLVLILASSIASPIHRITQIITQISKGNLNVDVDERLLNMKGEIGELARAFNRTIVSLKMAIGKSKDSLVSQQKEDKPEKPQIFK